MSDQATMTGLEQQANDAAPVIAPTAQAANDPATGASGAQLAPQTAAQQPVKFLGLAMPGPISRGMNNFNQTWQGWRTASVKFLPAFIVNNSSNILGFAHVMTEMMMFKASVRDSKLVHNPKNPINWVVEPITTVFKGVAEGAAPKDLNAKEFFSGNVLDNFRKRIVDTEDATKREYTRQMAEGKTRSQVSLANRWQSRSTFLGLMAWTLSTFIPEKKETPEEIERMAILRANHPMQYMGERLRQAVWIPEWNKHKRQMIGLAYMGVGACSMIGAWRGRKEVIVNGLKEGVYTFNRDYFMTSLISLASSFPLLFALDEKSGYGGFGSLMTLRIPFLYGSIQRKYKSSSDGGKIDGAHWYAGASVLFQAENIAQALIGGAEKVKKTQPDGSVIEVIVDHTGIRQEAVEKAREIRAARHESHQLAPQTEADAVVTPPPAATAPAPSAKPETVAPSAPQKEEAVAQSEEKTPEHHERHLHVAHHAAEESPVHKHEAKDEYSAHHETHEKKHEPSSNIRLDTPVVHMKPEKHGHDMAAIPAA